MQRIVIGKKVKCDYRKTVYGIIACGEKLLVTYSNKDKEYSLIGGGVEQGETLEESLKREFLEESGYLIDKINEFVNIDCFWRKRDGRLMETDANFFFCEVDENKKIEPLESFHEPMWIDISQALKLIPFPYQIEALKLLSNKI